MFLRDILIKKHFDKPELRLEDDAKRHFACSKKGKELLNVQQSVYLHTGAFLPDNF